jgi:hypothetical protein
LENASDAGNQSFVYFFNCGLGNDSYVLSSKADRLARLFTHQKISSGSNARGGIVDDGGIYSIGIICL